MRLSTLVVSALSAALLCATVAPAQAQKGTPARAPLTIPTPPGATVTFELDGQDSDLLGMVKDLLSGIENGKVGSLFQVRKGFTGFLSESQLGSLLKDVRHLRVISYRKLATPAAGQPDSTLLVGTPGEALSFYEPLLLREGGKRLLYSAEGTRILVVGFDAPRGMAVVVDDGSKVTVARTEGYLNAKALSSFVSTLPSGTPSGKAVPTQAIQQAEAKPVAVRTASSRPK